MVRFQKDYSRNMLERDQKKAEGSKDTSNGIGAIEIKNRINEKPELRQQHKE